MADAPIAQGTFKDRTVGLILFGVIEILGGLFFLLALALIAIMSFLGDSLPTGDSAPLAPSFPAGFGLGMSFLYLGWAAVLITLGIGSMLGRRWARSLSLLIAWMVLVCGSFGTAAMVMIWPHMKEAMGRAAAGGPEIPSAILLLPLALVVLLVVIVPGAFVLFLRSANVQATCEWKDPKPRWTDRRPLPILGLVLMAASGVLVPLYLPMSGGMFVAFGVILRGAPALLAALAIAAASAWCAWRIWHLDLRGWWATLILWLGFGASNLLMFDPDRQRLLWEEMGMPSEQIEQMTALAFPWHAMVPMMAVSLLAVLAFFLYTKKFFTERPKP
jgi:hypothetical protein